MIDTLGVVIENHELAPGYRLMTLEFDDQIPVRPGQFAMLKPLGSFEPLLRRALAIYKVPAPNRISFLYQVLGRGTQALASVPSGGKIQSLLPLGNFWPLPSFSGSAGVPGSALVVAGGIGSASLLMLAKELATVGIATEVFFGAANRTSALGSGLEDFKRLGLPLTVTTDDGSAGERGFVTGPLERVLERSGGPGITVYACGPWVMMERTARLAERAGARCLVSLEAPMGCGFGVCVGCVFAVKKDGPVGYDSYKRVCVDGSIFPAEIVRWEVTAMLH